MLDKIKSGTIRVALALALVASAYTMSNAQGVQIPIPISDEGISQVVDAVRPDPMTRTMMNEVRASVIAGMVNRNLEEMPLYTSIMGKMQPMMMQKLMKIQSKGLMDPNSGVPTKIAPPPF